MALINSLTHKGIMLSEIPYQKLSIEIQGKPLVLSPLQEEMAIAWVRKLSTVYVEDPVFCENFFVDFSEALGQKKLTDEEIDFSEVIEYIEKERARKEALSKEEKKAQREQRKVVREELKEIYG
ncbi:MAG: DNA topoisomerase I, partial [Candidatus Heimdallarchaeota archaeon]